MNPDKLDAQIIDAIIATDAEEIIAGGLRPFGIYKNLDPMIETDE